MLINCKTNCFFLCSCVTYGNFFANGNKIVTPNLKQPTAVPLVASTCFALGAHAMPCLAPPAQSKKGRRANQRLAKYECEASRKGVVQIDDWQNTCVKRQVGARHGKNVDCYEVSLLGLSYPFKARYDKGNIKKQANRNTKTILRAKATLSGEIFKEPFIDIFHTNLEQVAFSLEFTKKIKEKRYLFPKDFSTRCVWVTRNFGSEDTGSNAPACPLLFERDNKGQAGALEPASSPQRNVLVAKPPAVPLLAPTCPYLPLRGTARHRTAGSFATKIGKARVTSLLGPKRYGGRLFAVPCPFTCQSTIGKARVTPLLASSCPFLPPRGTARHGTARRGKKAHCKAPQKGTLHHSKAVIDHSGAVMQGTAKHRFGQKQITKSTDKKKQKKSVQFFSFKNSFCSTLYESSFCGACPKFKMLCKKRFVHGVRLASKSKYTYNSCLSGLDKVEQKNLHVLHKKIGDFLSSGDKIGHLLTNSCLPCLSPFRRTYKIKSCKKGQQESKQSKNKEYCKNSYTLQKISRKKGCMPILLNSSGRVITISKTQLVIQKTQNVLFYNSANLHIKKGEWVKEGSPVLTLTHQTLITGDIVQGIPRIEQLFEAFTSPPSTFKDRRVEKFKDVHDTLHSQVRDIFRKHWLKSVLPIAVRKSLEEIQYILVENIQKVYLSQGVLIADKHIEIVIRQIASKGQILDSGSTGLFLEEILPIRHIENANLTTPGKKCLYVPAVVGLTAAALSSDSFISAASFQETTRVLSRDAVVGKSDFLRGLKEKVVIGDLISAGTGLDIYFIYTTMLAR